MHGFRQINDVQIRNVKVGRPLVEFIRLCIKADTPPLLVGGPGVGKSAILEQAAEDCGIDFITRDLSLLEPPDLVGIPKVKNGITTYAPPSWLPRAGRRGGLIVFEELNRCAQRSEEQHV